MQKFNFINLAFLILAISLQAMQDNASEQKDVSKCQCEFGFFAKFFGAFSNQRYKKLAALQFRLRNFDNKSDEHFKQVRGLFCSMPIYKSEKHELIEITLKEHNAKNIEDVYRFLINNGTENAACGWDEYRPSVRRVCHIADHYYDYKDPAGIAELLLKSGDDFPAYNDGTRLTSNHSATNAVLTKFYDEWKKQQEKSIQKLAQNSDDN